MVVGGHALIYRESEMPIDGVCMAVLLIDVNKSGSCVIDCLGHDSPQPCYVSFVEEMAEALTERSHNAVSLSISSGVLSCDIFNVMSISLVFTIILLNYAFCAPCP